MNVQEILRLWTFSKGLDLTAWGQMRYNLMGNAGHWFPGANASAFDAAKVRASLGTHPFADGIPTILAEAHSMMADAPRERLGKS